MGIKKMLKNVQAEELKNYHKKHTDRVIFRYLIQFLIPYRKDVIILIILLLITSITGLTYPIGMTYIIQVIETKQIDRLIIIGLILGGLMFLNFITKKSYQLNINKLSQYVMRDLRARMFKKFQDLSLDFYSENPTGKLISMLTNDIGAVQMLISNSIIQLVGDLFQIISTAVVMLVWSWQLTLAILALLPLFGGIFYAFGLRSRYYWYKQRQTISELTRILQESVSGSKTIKAFVTEEQNIEVFESANKSDKEINLAAARLQAFLQPIIQLISATALGTAIFVGSKLVQLGILDITILLGYVILATQFINPFNNVGNLYNTAQLALAAGDRILSVLETKENIADKPDAIVLPPIQGIIEYRDVFFEYVKGIPVLREINFTSKPNQRIAFVGFTGAGKSTLISLLSRFYDPTKGEIYIDGHNLRDIKLESFRSQMGIVLQDTYLFSGTVMDNIRYGRLNATDEEIIDAAKQVGAHKFVMNLPEGYKTEVRERGSLLSVGQRQLISFARALLANPRILILDEATSSVDPYTELKIQEALEVLLHGRNSFVIAHRLSTILNADLILVLENGRIIQRGNHEELVSQQGLYNHLYEMQFMKSQEKEIMEKTS